MAKSSIHIENGNAGYLAHNDRSKATVNSIFKHNKNEIWNSKEDAFKMYRFELAARSDAYTKRTHQKLQKKTTTHLSAIVNLNENHNLDDVKKVASLLERKLDTKVFQIALHRDEGHINDEGEEVVNFHAHIEFMGLDQEGRSIRQKLKKKMLMDLQSETAMVLKMERGKEYVKGMHPRPKRLDTYEYKAHKKEESKTVKAKQKDLKEDIAKLKKQLQEQGAKRQQYAELEQLNRDLKARIKAKKLTIEQMRQQIDQLNTNLWATETQNQALKDEISILPSQDTFEELKTLKNDFQALQQINTSTQKQLSLSLSKISKFEEQNQAFRSRIKTQKIEISEITKELETAKNTNTRYQNTIKSLGQLLQKFYTFIFGKTPSNQSSIQKINEDLDAHIQKQKLQKIKEHDVTKVPTLLEQIEKKEAIEIQIEKNEDITNSIKP
jgi:DNA repair exonuclease SbcCD ATPase subunit